jgi:hypothetical protein
MMIGRAIESSMTGAAGGRRRLLGLLILVIAACGDPRDNPIWSLGGEPGLLFTIKQYYELNAFEQDASYLCPNPLLEGVTHSRITETEPGRLEVQISYYYRDAFRSDNNSNQNRMGNCIGLRSCQGFAQRSFVVVKDKDQLKVVDMSGPKRGVVL